MVEYVGILVYWYVAYIPILPRSYVLNFLYDLATPRPMVPLVL